MSAPPSSRIVVCARSLDRHAQAALRPGARLQVHSVFEKALNLIDHKGRVLSIVCPMVGNGPGTLVVDAMYAGGFPVKLGTPALAARVQSEGILVIGPRVSLDLSCAKVWRPPRGPSSADRERVRYNVELASALAWELRGADGLAGLLTYRDNLLRTESSALRQQPLGLSPLVRTAWEALAQLLPVWRERRAKAVGHAARLLVGLGPGQTPSGDDLLAGFMVAQARACEVLTGAKRICAGHDCAALRASCLAAARGRTTDLGLARLRYAVEGDLDERSMLLLCSLLGGEPGEVEAATRELLGYGHSSGLDTLVGLLLGVGLELHG